MRIRRHLTYANVMSTLAIFMLLGGAAVAASKITTKDIKNKAVTKAKIDKKAVSSSRLDKQAVKKGKIQDLAVSNQKLENATYWAYVDPGPPIAIVRGYNADSAESTGVGNYRVQFSTNDPSEDGIGQCSFQVTPGHLGAGREVSANIDATDDTKVHVRLRNSVGAAVDGPFSIAVFC